LGSVTLCWKEWELKGGGVGVECTNGRGRDPFERAVKGETHMGGERDRLRLIPWKTFRKKVMEV